MHTYTRIYFSHKTCLGAANNTFKVFLKYKLIHPIIIPLNFWKQGKVEAVENLSNYIHLKYEMSQQG